jgi:acyl carrier protein
MTIEDVIQKVEEETGQKVTAETNLNDLGLDSLDFVDLLVQIGEIPDSVVPRINTVNDLYLAASCQL